MATTKVVVHAAIQMAHPDGTKLTRKAVAEYLREVLEGVGMETESSGRMLVSKATIRSVDMD